MSTGMCLVLDSQPEFRRSVFNGGKPLVRFDEALTALARRLGVRPLSDFLTMSRAEAVELIGDEAVEEAEARGRLEGGRWVCDGQYLWSVDDEWFPPEEGLRTLGALLERLEAEPTSLEGVQDADDLESVVLALRDAQEMLTDAQRRGRRFHMA